MASDDVVETLNELIETCRDAEQGFRAAADAVGDSAIKRLFMTYAQQRAEFADVLEDEVRRLGGTPKQRGTVTGALHRGWMNITAAVTGRDERAVIAEAERGEGVAVSTYEEALQIASLPADVRGVIQRQLARVKEAHDCVRELKRAA
jgi:uncharacterized protein (TIGR02284 family)